MSAVTAPGGIAIGSYPRPMVPRWRKAMDRAQTWYRRCGRWSGWAWDLPKSKWARDSNPFTATAREEMHDASLTFSTLMNRAHKS